MLKMQIAFRYAFNKRKYQRKSSIYLIIGIAVCLFSIIIVMSIMNGLQDGQLQAIRYLDSFDLVIENSSLTPEIVRSIPNVNDAFYFSDQNVLLKNTRSGNTLFCRLRIIDNLMYSNKEMINFSEGDSSYLSYSLKNQLNFRINDTLQITFFKKGKTNIPVPLNKLMSFNGVYSSTYSNFDKNTIISIRDNFNFLNDSIEYSLGVRTEGNIKEIKNLIKRIDSNAVIYDWKEQNSSLYSAFILEKTLVLVFLFFICCIFCLNLKNSVTRIIKLKIKDSGILMAIGMNKNSIYEIFVLYGTIICFISVIIGSFSGYIVSKNIDAILLSLDTLFSLFGKTLYLSSIPFKTLITYKEIFFYSLFVMFINFFFISKEIIKAINKDIIGVINNDSY